MITAFREAGLTVFERGWLSSNCILFDAGLGNETVLVDSGYWIHSAQTLALLRHTLGSRRLDRIVNSHLHSDHCGGNAALSAEYACEIDVPESEVSNVDVWDESLLSYDVTGQHCPRFSRTGAISAGTDIQLGGAPWRVLPAPGHDPHSLALYQPTLQLLISADALWENGFGVVFPEIDGVDAFGAVRATLMSFAAVPIRWVIPGHGAPFQNAGAAIERALARLINFERAPERHARHAAKVLVKFHMLEVTRTSRTDLVNWMSSTPLLARLRQQYALESDPAHWAETVIDDLVRSGALESTGHIIRDK